MAFQFLKQFAATALHFPLMSPSNTPSLRVWDLPTRLFHWLLAASVVALIVTAKIGGNAMEWHLRLGHVVLALLLFRLIWGVLGGHWSRFLTFVPSPARLVRYVRGQGSASEDVGHSPLGALSVIAMLLVLGLQVATGLVSDDEIAFAGSLVRFVSSDTINWATRWHQGWGQWLLWAMLGLHLAAIAFYTLVQRKKLVAAMLHGDKPQPAPAQPASRDGAGQRLSALLFALSCAVIAYWVWTRATAF